MVKTILVRCVDPRFGEEWSAPVLEAVGPHYCLTELGGIDTLGDDGFNVLVAKAEALLGINPAIERLVVLFHQDCAWCKAQSISDPEQLNLARRLTKRLAEAFSSLKVDMGEVDTNGKVTLVASKAA
ncbi:MAG: hypothetical protein G01um101430_231 [Parcubacteria group bacterium Gr01-1014_30]|nr:MAG: hypothetical protein G01um101430_231 [Parcubacteria group bacterium Gr01-1014_30]